LARAAAGLPLTKYYERTGGAPTPDTTKDGTLLRRRRYRQIKHIADSRDVWGNSAVTGQRAFFCGSGFPGDTVVDMNNVWLGTAFSGYRFRYNGSTWVRDETDQADILDNTMDPPNCICNDPSSCYAGDLPTRENGELQPGDFIEPGVAEEMRLLIDLCRWTLALQGTFSGSRIGSNEKLYNSLTHTSLADAKDDVTTNWPDLTPSTGTTPPFVTNSRTSVSHVPFSVPDDRASAIYEAYRRKTASYTTTLARKVRCYADADYFTTTEATNEFETVQGLQQGQWGKVTPDVGPTTARNAEAQIGDPSLPQPAWPTRDVSHDPTDPAAYADSASRGAKVTNIVSVILWNVSGGFQYSTHSD
jgi:hypothetical protein